MTIQQSTNAERTAVMMKNGTYLFRASGSHLAAAALLLVALGGCANHDNMTTSAISDDYRQRHPITLTQAEHNVDIPVASSDRRLTQGTRDTIRGFVQDYKAHATGNVEILIPQGSPNSRASAEIRGQVRQELIANGIPSKRIIENSYAAGGDGDAAPMRLHFMATTAVTNACGQWPDDLAANSFDNQNYYNFGCSTQNNLAAQVANPTDLVAPRGQTPIDAEQRGTVIDNYRNGTVPTSSSTTTTGFGGG